MLEPNDLDDLITAIESLRADPWIQVLIPTLSGIVGVISGFFLSVAKGAFDRKAARRDQITNAIRERRQAAVDVFSAEVKWIDENLGFSGGKTDWAPHNEARKFGPDLFSKTGKVTDDVVTPAVRQFTIVLDSTIRSWSRPKDSYFREFTRLTKDTKASIRKEVTTVRVAAQHWVDNDQEARILTDVLTKSRERIKALSDQSDDGKLNYKPRIFR
jgi:hypothetical protein